MLRVASLGALLKPASCGANPSKIVSHGSQVLEEVEVDDGVVLDMVVCVDEVLALDVDVDVEVEAVVLVDVLVVVTELTLVVLEVDDEVEVLDKLVVVVVVLVVVMVD